MRPGWTTVDYRTYVMTGDGEIEQGQVWEASMHAGNHGLDNLTLIVDRNRHQQTDAVAKVQPLDPLAPSSKPFNWESPRDRRPQSR